jgi:hypothetical protein
MTDEYEYVNPFEIVPGDMIMWANVWRLVIAAQNVKSTALDDYQYRMLTMIYDNGRVSKKTIGEHQFGTIRRLKQDDS